MILFLVEDKDNKLLIKLPGYHVYFIILNGYSDHIHIFLGLNPAISVSDTVHDIKRGSSLFINENKLVPGKFSWQDGYGGFTYSQSQIGDVYRYIENQEAHHSGKSFRKEYISILEKNKIEFDARFLFDFFD